MQKDKEMAKLKFIFIIFLFLCETAYSNPCEFTAKVTPEKETDRVKNIYEDTCAWFIQTFEAVPSPDIPLDEVTFIQSWSSVEHIENPERYNSFSHGWFYSSKEKEVNQIFISENTNSEIWNITPLWLDSLIAHELVHYFTKASKWNTLSQVEKMNILILESHAYWSQDQYIRRHSKGGRIKLANYLKEVKKKPPHHTFEVDAHHLFRSSHRNYIESAIHWFESNPKGKFNNIVNGIYRIP